MIVEALELSCTFLDFRHNEPTVQIIFPDLLTVVMMFVSSVKQTLKISQICTQYTQMWRRSLSTTTSSTFPSSLEANATTTESFRLNRCFPLLSRREADKAIVSGRVKINNKSAALGTKLVDGDVLHLDGKLIQWNKHKDNTLTPLSQGINNAMNIYIKMWKSKGMFTCCFMSNSHVNSFFCE